MTDLLYLNDAYLADFEATVVAVQGSMVALDRTAFYSTSGGQQHDTGVLDGRRVLDVVKEDHIVWHHLATDAPPVGSTVRCTIDWDRRHANMRTHTAMHILCGVIWNIYGVQVTGGNMEPLAGRMDFDFHPLPGDFKETVEAAVNAEICADRPVTVSYVHRDEAVLDASVVRTKVSLVPDVENIRFVEIVGLDKQADGGTHVRSTREIGGVEIRKVESKGKANKRVRLAVVNAT